MIKYLRLLLMLCMLAPSYLAHAQTGSSLDNTLTALQKQAAGYPFEKVHLHLDKPTYAGGDTIWFKGYTVIGAAHQLSALSGVLNVELVDERNEIIKSVKLPIANGLSYGDMPLADTLKDGNYHLRAYTNWMRNAGTAYFYNNPIKIGNPITNTVFTKASTSYTQQNGKPVITTRITYTNVNGEPFARREVKYTILQNKLEAASGTAVTDDGGNVSIAFVNPSPQAAAGRLVTTIKIGAKPVTKEIALTPATNVADVQFFPESGCLVNGITSKVAFKAVDLNGLGANVKGTVLDDQNKEVASFASTHLGMGSFLFTPQAGRTYNAKIDFANGKTTAINLPAATDKGYVITIDNTDADNLPVKIVSSNMPQDVTLVAQTGGVVCFIAKSVPGKATFNATIPKSKFPTGIVQFTLFSASGEPLNERLVFVQRNDQLKLSLHPDQTTYATRGKVKVDFSAKDNNGQPVTGSFSVAVINENELPVDENAETTILSNLLLTADIAGYIEKPNYYFINDDAKTRADLDVLMLTQGYHRYEWKKLMSNDNPVIAYQPERGLTLAGRVLGRDKKPVVRGAVSLFSMNGGGMLDTLTNEQGRFVFDNIDFKDSTIVTIKALNAKKSNNVKIEMDSPPVQTGMIGNDGAVVATTDNNNMDYLQSVRKAYNEKIKLGLADGSGTLLQEVNIKSVRARALEYSANLNGAGNANQVIYADNMLKGCPTFRDCLDGRLAGVEFSSASGNPVSTRSRTSFSSDTSKAFGSTDMTIVYNGMVVQPAQVSGFLGSLNMSEVSTIEVLRSIQFLAIYGSRGGNGVIIITSKHGKDINLDIDVPRYDDKAPGMVNYMPKGYYKSREFYSPRYDVPGTQGPDLRTTIYWKPLLQTGKEGTQSFGYFNADSKGSYRVVVEGIDNAGQIGRQVYRYKVE